MIIGKIIILFSSITLIDNHLIKNPIKGGIPIKEKKFNIKNILISKLLFRYKNNCLIKNNLPLFIM